MFRQTVDADETRRHTAAGDVCIFQRLKSRRKIVAVVGPIIPSIWTVGDIGACNSRALVCTVYGIWWRNSIAGEMGLPAAPFGQSSNITCCTLAFQRVIHAPSGQKWREIDGGTWMELGR